jgi:hypothetical protein
MVDHYTAEAWVHVAKIGDRFAALQPVYDADIDRFGGLPEGRCGPRDRAALGLGTAVALGPLPGLDRLAGDRRRAGVPGRAGDQWLRQALDQYLQSSAYGLSCTTPWSSCARPWPASSTATTAPG